MNNFFENLQSAYTALEDRLNKDTKEAVKFLKSRPYKTKGEEYMAKGKGIIFLKPPSHKALINPKRDLASRVLINLNIGYIAKFLPGDQIGNQFYVSMGDFPRNDFEETNVQVLRSYGLTMENGFIIPEHKVIGIKFDTSGKFSVDEAGYGITITEDISENGVYEVSDVMAHHFICLENSPEVLLSYKQHMERLLEIYHDPKIKPSIHRHCTPKDPMLPLSRMLLIRIKDSKGEIVIGDLNNLAFDRKIKH